MAMPDFDLPRIIRSIYGELQAIEKWLVSGSQVAVDIVGIPFQTIWRDFLQKVCSRKSFRFTICSLKLALSMYPGPIIARHPRILMFRFVTSQQLEKHFINLQFRRFMNTVNWPPKFYLVTVSSDRISIIQINDDDRWPRATMLCRSKSQSFSSKGDNLMFKSFWFTEPWTAFSTTSIDMTWR